MIFNTVFIVVYIITTYGKIRKKYFYKTAIPPCCERQGILARFLGEKCQFQVTNLDPLNDEQRLALFEDAVNNKKKICISTTLSTENAVPCSKSRLAPIPPPRPTAGLPAMPPPNMLALERERIEKLKAEQAKNQESKQGWLAKLKFW